MASDVIPVRPQDKVPFTCCRCGNCCRNVEEQIMLEPLDAYHLGRFLRQHGGDVHSIEDVYSRYAEPMLLAQGFPIFTLKTTKVSVKDWMYQNFTRDTQAFVEADAAALTELGQLLRELGQEGQQNCLFHLLYYRYYNFDLDQPFMEQYRANHQGLLTELKKHLDKNEKEA